MSATPWVRAPRAVRAGDGDGDEWDAPPAILVERALGLGVADAVDPVDEARPGQPTGNVRLLDPRQQVSRPVEPAERVEPAEAAAPGGRPASLPTSPADQDGLYRGVLWVAWAVEECSRGFTRLSARLGNLERRVDLVAAQKVPEPGPVFDADQADRRPQLDDETRAALQRVETTVDEARTEARRRIDGLEERLRQLDFVPLKVSNLQRSVDQLSAALRKGAAAGAAEPPKDPSVGAELQDLRQQLTAAHQRLAELDARVGTEPVVVVVEEEVRRHADRLATAAPAARVDVEGVYRELDAVAEFVAARAAATAESLERIGPLEAAVLELRRDVRRAVGDRTAAQAGNDVEPRLQEVEARVRELEASSRQVDRLYRALEHAVQAETSAPPGPNGHRPRDTRR
jgi:DNA repair ATPase RecN